MYFNLFWDYKAVKMFIVHVEHFSYQLHVWIYGIFKKCLFHLKVASMNKLYLFWGCLTEPHNACNTVQIKHVYHKQDRLPVNTVMLYTFQAQFYTYLLWTNIFGIQKGEVEGGDQGVRPVFWVPRCVPLLNYVFQVKGGSCSSAGKYFVP